MLQTRINSSIDRFQARILYSAIIATVFLSSVVSGTLFAADKAPEKAPRPPAVGDAAKNFELKTFEDKKVQFDELKKSGPVVLVMLRGYPGYQCPICTKQVAQLISKAKEFKAAKANVLFVYPGPAKNLTEQAKEFMKGTTLPENFQLALDPDYEFTNAYHLRWDAPRETAYPSTFVIGKDGKITFASVSKSHGGRADIKEIVKTLNEKK